VARTTIDRSRRRWVIAALAALVALLILLGALSGFYVDILFFREVGQSGVFWTIFWSKLVLGLIFGAIFFVLLLVNLVIVQRLAPRFRVFSPEQEVIDRYRRAFAPYTRYLIPALAAVIALFVGAAASGQWKVFLLWRSSGGVTFGRADPLFHRDAAYYIFSLPFQKFVQGWFFSALVGITVIVGIAHYLTGGIRTQTTGERVTPQVKAHLSVLLGLIVLVKAWGYYLGKFDLLTSERGVVTGASYTDIHAQLPALKLLVFIAIACAVLFLVNIRFRGWALPVIGIGLLGVVSIVVGGLVPAAVQKFSVDPQEFQKEQVYIQRNLDATQFAFGLDKIHLTSASPTATVASSAAIPDKPTLDNIRLWNPSVLQTNYEAVQRLQQYYEFSDVDVDRYQINGNETQVMLSAREISQNGIPGSKTWQNTHLVYTHGYGAVASAVNTVTSTGGPDLILFDIPPTGPPTGSNITVSPGHGSQLYYTERPPDTPYLVVDTKQRELNYPQGTGQVTTQYAGKGGIPVGGFFRKLVFAYRFRDINLLISGLIDSDSKIMIYRDLRTRVQKVAPFLKYDKDPYAVIAGGSLYYVWDAYTTTDLFPYSERANLSDATGTDLSGRANYIRNPVKVVMNAYDGTLRFYVVDKTDPLIQVWENAFPHLFTDVTQAPLEIQQHFRYPEDLLMTQAAQFATYHVQDPQTFYSGDRAWAIPLALSTRPEATTSAGNGPFRPYYVVSKLPGSDSEHFVLFEPFSPPSRTNMVAYLAAGSDLLSSTESTQDAGGYGNLTSLQFPATGNVLGPTQARNLINQDPTTSSQISLLSQRGSQVQFGDLLIVPIEDSFLYVQPIYIASSQASSIPQLKLVAVVNGTQVSLGTTLQDALTKALGTPAGGETCPDGSQPPCVTPPTQTVAALLAQAVQEFQAAETALKAGDLAGYQQHIDAAKSLVAQANELAGGSTGTGGTGGTPSPTPSASASATP
jgi:uncharacterized membrane protein (UPF0182 family)